MNWVTSDGMSHCQKSKMEAQSLRDVNGLENKKPSLRREREQEPNSVTKEAFGTNYEKNFQNFG